MLAQKGLVRAEKKIRSGKFDVVILDEILCALDLGLLKAQDVLALMRKMPECIELVLTGRNAPIALINAADLVSEIREIKHYYHKGIKARKGIEF